MDTDIVLPPLPHTDLSNIPTLDTGDLFLFVCLFQTLISVNLSGLLKYNVRIKTINMLERTVLSHRKVFLGNSEFYKKSKIL